VRVREKLEHQAVADEVCRARTDRLVQLQQLGGGVVRRFEFPPEFESKQPLVEATRPRGVADTQTYVVENSSVTDHYNLQDVGG
jgi:hypothetical protein